MESRNYYAEAAGIGIGVGVYNLTKKNINKAYTKLSKPSKILNNTNHSIYTDAAEKAFAHSDLPSKGVTLHKVNSSNYLTETTAILSKDPNKHQNTEKLVRKVENIAKNNKAIYNSFSSSIIINAEKRGISLFHEMGHAANHTGSGLKRGLHNIRGYSKLGIWGILAASLLEKDTGDNSFIKENCGLLASSAMIPTIAEEYMASKNGQKMAKSYLKYSDLCHMKIWNTKCLGSYIVGAAAIGIGTWAAVKVKDTITNFIDSIQDKKITG